MENKITDNIKNTEEKIRNYFGDKKKIAVAFSGGVDSTLLLKLAVVCCERVKAYYVRTQFQPSWEYREACENAEIIGAEMETIKMNVLSCEEIRENPADRCYFCKKQIMGKILEKAGEDGFTILADGSNMSDNPLERPGMKALSEYGIISPLREMGFTKKDVRQLSSHFNLNTAEKPAYSCLATRIPSGTEITEGNLAATEECEEFLMKIGFSDFRVRNEGEMARIESRAEDMKRLIEKREEILDFFSKYYKKTVLDLKER